MINFLLKRGFCTSKQLNNIEYIVKQYRLNKYMWNEHQTNTFYGQLENDFNNLQQQNDKIQAAEIVYNNELQDDQFWDNFQIYIENNTQNLTRVNLIKSINFLLKKDIIIDDIKKYLSDVEYTNIDIKFMIQILQIQNYFNIIDDKLKQQLKQQILDLKINIDDQNILAELIQISGKLFQFDNELSFQIQDLIAQFINQDLFQYDNFLQEQELKELEEFYEKTTWQSISYVLQALSIENFVNVNHIQRIQDIIIRKSETEMIDLKNSTIILQCAQKYIDFYEIGIIMRIFDMLYMQIRHINLFEQINDKDQLLDFLKVCENFIQFNETNMVCQNLMEFLKKEIIENKFKFLINQDYEKIYFIYLNLPNPDLEFLKEIQKQI